MKILLIPGVLLLMAGVVAACSSPTGMLAGPACDMTVAELKPRMKELIARAKQDENFTISVCGYLRYGFEDKNLLSRPDHAGAACVSAWPRTKPGLIRRLEGLHGQYVRVTGFPWDGDAQNSVSFSHCSLAEGFAIQSVERASPPEGV